LGRRGRASSCEIVSEKAPGKDERKIGREARQEEGGDRRRHKALATGKEIKKMHKWEKGRQKKAEEGEIACKIDPLQAGRGGGSDWKKERGRCGKSRETSRRRKEKCRGKERERKRRVTHDAGRPDGESKEDDGRRSSDALRRRFSAHRREGKEEGAFGVGEQEAGKLM
jgi:hypothetical protein